jgi:O-antigen ligase
VKAISTAGARFRGVIIAAAVLCAAAVVLTAVLCSPLPLFLPAAAIATLLLGHGVLTAPVQILTLFLLVIVNFDFVKFGGSKLTLDVAVSSALLWALLVRALLEGRRLFTTAAEWAYVAFLGVTLISTAAGVSPLASLKRWGRDLEQLVVFSYLLALPLALRDRKRLVGAVLLSSIFPCVIGLAGMIFHVPALLGAPTPIGGDEWAERIAATLSHPVTFSIYLALVATMTLSFLWDGRWFPRRWLAPLLALQLATLYLTYGRTGWGAFLVAAVALVWLRGRARLFWIGVPLAAIGLWLALPSFFGRWSTALEVSRENSFLWRIGLWTFALRRFPEHPVFGSGPGTFMEYISYYKTGVASHQTWVGLLIETGAVGTLAFIVLLFATGRAIVRSRRAALPDHDPLSEGVLAVLIGFLAGSFGAYLFALPSAIIYFWVLAALALNRNEEGAARPVVVGTENPVRCSDTQ